MSTLEESFAKLLGRQPTDKEKQDLYRVRDALQLKNSDALWMVLMALGHYETAYGKFPALIREAAKGTLADVKATAETQMKAAAEATKRDLVGAVVRTAEQIAGDTATATRFRWTVGCLATSVVSLLLVGLLAYWRGATAGHARGWGEGYRLAVDEKAAAAWANTPEGQVAYGLARAGSIHLLATCSGIGWARKGRVCWPSSKAEKGTAQGWVLLDGRIGR